jgi:Heparinase II/III-like protein
MRSGPLATLIAATGLITATAISSAADGGFHAPAAAVVLSTLKAEHPRLMLDRMALDGIRKSIERDPVAARIHRSVLADADKALKKPVAVHELRDGRRLLYVSSEVSQRVTTLAYAFHMTGRKDYAERAWADLDAAAGFKDWNPAHFLDTAVMTGALAIGYDWLWDQWTPAQRTRLREAIVKLGLEPALAAYRQPRGWHKVDYNWNQVCNGGITMGALAVADDEPGITSEVLSHAIASLPRAMGDYAPDGAGKEGASYWAFGSQYNVLMLASLESALGTDFGLGGIHGFKQSGDYQIYLSGAGRMSFDFGDCSLHALSTPQHFWMARRYGIPRYASFRHDALRDGGAGGMWDLLWFHPPTEHAFSQLPPDRHFAGAECASMRDSWTGSGFTVAMQGGANHWTHRHYDLGSFVLEADGVRWIIDAGKERETYQRHANKLAREDFYRVRAEGHNTLVINPDKGPGQTPNGMAKFTTFDSRSEAAKAVLDLTNAYREQANRVTRTYDLLRGKSFVVTDEIDLPKASRIVSSFHTKAEVKLFPDKRKAILTQAGKSLEASLISPAGAAFEVLPAAPGPASPNPAKQASNNGMRKLTVTLDDVSSTTIRVKFSASSGG